MITPECGHPECGDGLENLSDAELIILLATRKAMLMWSFLLYPEKGKLRSLVN